MHLTSRLFGCLVAATLSVPAFAQTDSHVPGELLIGFESEADRDALTNEIEKTRETLRAGGQIPAGLSVEKRGDADLKIVIDFPESVKTRLRSDPQAELNLLEELARQLKQQNAKIRYAHPNWMMGLDLPPTAAPPDVEMRLQSLDGGADQDSQRLPSGAPNDPLYRAGMQWHFQPPPVGMNAVGAWEQTTGSRDIVVAVLDTGIVASHEDIGASGNVGRGYNFVSYDGCANQRVPRSAGGIDPGDECPQKKWPSSWHGTHVAGTIGAAVSNNGAGVTGVAWNVTIVPVRVLGKLGSGPTSDIIDGLRWAAGLPVQGVPPIAKRADVINLSLTGRRECTGANSQAYIDAINAARRAGSVVVVAAGNGSTLDEKGQVCERGPNTPNCQHRQEDIRRYQPASCPGVISVAAGDSRGMLAPYSNFGAVTTMAPGGNVALTQEYNIFGQRRRLSMGVWSVVSGAYFPMNGTSQAAPHVAGAIALALTKHPEWRGKPELIEQKVRASAVPLRPGACPPDKPCGPGYFDALKLLNQ